MTIEELLKKVRHYEQLDFELRQEIRSAISLFLMDTSEENPLEVDIQLDTPMTSMMEAPKITSCWQYPTEGWITFKMDDFELDYDSFQTQELITILDYFTK